MKQINFIYIELIDIVSTKISLYLFLKENKTQYIAFL